jgi:tetratricopeptide (TPR) repeat protein
VISIAAAVAALAAGVAAGALALAERTERLEDELRKERDKWESDRSQKSAEMATRESRIQSLLAVPLVGGRLPRLSEVSDGELGPTETRYTASGDAPYVERLAVDGKLQNALAEIGPPYPFVLVVGRSKSGKSCTAVQAARTVFAETDPPIILPINGEALVRLVAEDLLFDEVQEPALVWLDDVTVVDLQHLTGSVLHRVGEWAVIVGTITAARVDDIERSNSDATRTARIALQQATTFNLAFELTLSELAEAERLYPNEEVVSSIAETLTGAHQLLRKYNAGPDTNPAGCAVVQAAVDIRRIDPARPIIRADLSRLFPLYLHALRPDLDPTAHRFEGGLDWAREPVASHVALLRRLADPMSRAVESERFEPFDYVIGADDGNDEYPSRAIPDAVWTELLALSLPSNMFNIGLTATLRGRLEIATTAYQLAIDSGQSDVVPAAAFNLGALLAQQGRPEQAMVAYGLVVELDETDQDARAAIGREVLPASRVGAAEDEAWDNDGIKADRLADGSPSAGRPRLVRMAILSTQEQPWAMLAVLLNLGVMLHERGDFDRAKAAYLRVIDSGYSDPSATALVNLGALLDEQGDVAEAEATYQRAADLEGANAAMRLGALATFLRKHGKVEAAKDTYQRIIDLGDPAVAPGAAFGLGLLLDTEGDVEGATSAYQYAVESRRPGVATGAAFNLGRMLGANGNVEGAKAAFQTAVELEDPDCAPMAAWGLGLMLHVEGDIVGARTAYQLAVDSNHPEAIRCAQERLRQLNGEA